MTEKLLHYYQQLHKEYFKQRGWNGESWLMAWRLVKKSKDDETLMQYIMTLLDNLTPTAKSEEIRKELRLMIND